MSLDIKAFETLYESDFGLTPSKYISFFTFSHRLNDYWGAVELFKMNADKVMTEKEFDVAFETYVFSRKTIQKLKVLNDEKQYGDDVTNYLNEILESDVEIIYMQIS